MKPLTINSVGIVKRGPLHGFYGIIVAFDSETDEATIQLSATNSITVSSEDIQGIVPEETHTLDHQESETLLGMAQDILDRGMVPGGAKTDKIEEIVAHVFDMWGDVKEGKKLEITVKITG